MPTDRSTSGPANATNPSAAPTAPASFADDLAEAVALLRGLPVARDAVGEARRRVLDWAAARPHLRAQLAVDEPPGATRAGYDLLLDHPEGGTVALSAEVDDGIPWLVDHSTHWAAANILSVDGAGLSIAGALSAIRALGVRDRQLHERLVDHRIVLNELEGALQQPTTAEIQAAADEFRRRRGLTGRAQTLEWLAEAGMSPEMFQTHARTQALVARVRDRFAGEPARRHLAEHPEDFTVRRAVWVTGRHADDLSALLEGPVEDFAARCLAALELPAGPSGNTPQLLATTALTPRLPEPLRTVPQKTAIGPVPYEGAYLAGVVHEVVAPDPDAPEVLEAARDAAFQAWLDERRRTAEIRWFWL
ncbi:TIGR04500 family putative peptide maturation system protein [Microbispora sp. H10670]|uniref:TIGR04500 family putative peptide maturation system protein n=1 Tax=Microbispora sp. H10670 TaxID=2729108 RepID=UPI0015FF66CD|nr:TIGR04500 family putative peptide maturation system protein [Microbispora sp. H10670]